MAEHVRHRNSQLTSSTAGGTGAFWDLSSRQPPHHFIGGLLLEHFRGRRRAQRWRLRGEHSPSASASSAHTNTTTSSPSNISAIFASMGIDLGWVTLDLIAARRHIVLHLQTLAYTIDVYREKSNPRATQPLSMPPSWRFSPARRGPAERAANLLPQFLAPRRFDSRSGRRRHATGALWGLFKKMVVADNCGVFVDHVFSNYQTVGS